MTPEELKNILDELEPLRAARVPLEAVRWTHGRRDGPVALVTGPGSRARADSSSGLKQTPGYVRVECFLARLDDRWLSRQPYSHFKDDILDLLRQRQ